MRRLFVVDGGGVTRAISRMFVVDSGGVSRLVFGADAIAAADVLASSSEDSPTAATASYTLANDGDIDATAGTNGVVDIGDWIAPKTNMSLYEARLVQNSGDAITGAALNTFLSLGTSRTWTLVRGTNGTSNAAATLTIRRIADSVVMDTAAITFQAQRLP